MEKKQLIDIATENCLLLLNPKKVASVQSLRLAEYLAKKSIKQKRNISKKNHLEFLLWVAGKKDIRSAIEDMLFEDKNDILAVGLDKKKFERGIKRILFRKLRLDLPNDAEPKELERIALSRISN